MVRIFIIANNIMKIVVLGFAYFFLLVRFFSLFCSYKDISPNYVGCNDDVGGLGIYDAIVLVSKIEVSTEIRPPLLQ